MTAFERRGFEFRQEAKKIVLDFMKTFSDCSNNGEGLTQAAISRACNFEWGDYANTTSSQQQYWTVGLLRELEKEKLIIRDLHTKRWKLSE